MFRSRKNSLFYPRSPKHHISYHYEFYFSFQDLTTLYHCNYMIGCKEFNVSHNKLTSLSQCHNLQVTEIIKANDNQINDLDGIANLKNLKALDLKNNCILFF